MLVKNKIVFNTSILYVKMVITILINFYSTRLVLMALGVNDFGIYTVIAGLIGSLSFVSASMASSTQRFLSFSIGENNLKKTKLFFSNSVFLHLVIGGLLVILLVFIGKYFIVHKMNIDQEKIEIALSLFYFVVVTTFISIISVPYDAVVDAHENMLFVSIIGVLESVLKLAIAFYLTFIDSDQLFTYGLLLLISAIFIRIIKQIYTIRKYQECRNISFKDVEKGVINELLHFAGWNILGIFVYMARNQGVLVVLSLFFSTAIIAAYGIANQIINQMSFFSETMMKTLRPQIIKSEGRGERSKMITLSIQASKFSFFLMSFFLIPFYFEVDLILNLWLKEVPDFTILFCKLILILMLLRQLTVGVIISAHAIGDIKKFQLMTSPIQLLSLPIGYLLFYLGYPAYSIIFLMIFLEMVSIFLRVFYYKKAVSLSKLTYFKNVILKSSFSFVICFVLVYFLKYSLTFLDSKYLAAVIVFGFSMLSYPIFFYFLSLNNIEKIEIDKYLTSFKNKFFSK